MERAHKSASPLTPMSLSSDYASTLGAPYEPSRLRSSISVELDDPVRDRIEEDLSWELHHDLHEEDIETPTPQTAADRALVI